MKWLIRWLLETVGWIPTSAYIARVSEEHPDQQELPPRILHVVGGKSFQKWAYLKCPCPCGELIMLSLSKTKRPHWQVAIDWLDRPTVTPSIWQTAECFSHFWLKKGCVEWTKDTGQPPRGFEPPF